MARLAARRRTGVGARLGQVLRGVAVLGLVGAAVVFGLRLAFPLPDLSDRPAGTALAPSAATALGRVVLPAMAEHDGASGVVPLRDGREAFAARVHLVRNAEASLDVQYYIWQGDTTGTLLLDELRAAAERGVRVRLLLDDNGITGLDRELAALDALPTMKVRLFNPFTLRDPKLLAYAFDFPRLNRRMHNKSLTADGVASVIGGRNIGDIYFAFGTAHYIDMDVLAVGSAAAEVSADFDRYWASGSAYPAGMILPAAPEGLDLLRDAAAAAGADPAAEPYLGAIADSPMIAELQSGMLELEWVPVTLISDDPAKGLGTAVEEDLLVSRLIEILARPERGVDLVSAYFAPGTRGAGLLTTLAERGVRGRVLTNALEATDVPLVHGGYAEARPILLAAGVELYELRADPAAPAEGRRRLELPGSTSTSLHSKTFAFDGGSVFIGSFNFDPRSARLNTEMGFLIESPAIAREVAEELDAVPEGGAYVVRLGAEGDLEWLLKAADGQTVVYDVEPNTSFAMRALVGLVGILPIGWML